MDIQITSMSRAISTLNLWNGIYKTSTANFQVDYKLDTGKHNINALLGYGTERTRNVLTTLTYEGFPNDEVLNNVASAKWSSGQNQILQKHGLNSWFTRLNYGYFNISQNLASEPMLHQNLVLTTNGDISLHFLLLG